jgi:hypothetical protein
MSSFFTSQHMPCADCGASLPTGERAIHTCDPEREIEYHWFLVQDELPSFDDGLSAYLASAQGRFAQWLAERERRRCPGDPS